MCSVYTKTSKPIIPNAWEALKNLDDNIRIGSKQVSIANKIRHHKIYDVSSIR